MTIEEAIAHCYEVAEGKTEQGKCESCAHEHKQLAMWLEELVAYRKLISRKNAPLTLDELREMDGEPVWVIMNEDDEISVSQWAIVSTDIECVLGLKLDFRFEDYGYWLAYRRKPKEETV